LQVAVIGGLEHAGLICAAGLAEMGHQVLVLDRDPRLIADLQDGRFPPAAGAGLIQLWRGLLAAGCLSCTTDAGGLAERRVVFLCQEDWDALQSSLLTTCSALSGPAVLALMGAMPVGGTDRLAATAASATKAMVDVLACPVFFRSGSGIEGFRRPDRIVLGSRSAQALATVREVFAPLGVPIVATTPVNAELIAYATGAHLALRTSFVNELAAICRRWDGNIGEVARAVGMDHRIGRHFLEPGVGFASPGPEADVWALVAAAQAKGWRPALLEATLAVNERQRRLVVEELEQALLDLRGRRIAVLGLAAQPGRADRCGTHARRVIALLQEAGACLAAHDPGLGPDCPGLPAGVELTSTPLAAVAKAEAAVFLTAWPQYRQLDFCQIKTAMARPLIIDGCRLLTPARVAGIEYRGIGV
jgi:UDPglucose 6-dehydrogenase